MSTALVLAVPRGAMVCAFCDTRTYATPDNALPGHDTTVVHPWYPATVHVCPPEENR